MFILIICLVLRTISSTTAQSGYPRNLFRSPVDFELSLSGSYGEIRTNHFHSGIDIRTDGKSGKPVYAAAEGYVSRIFVSPWGFGKALYVSHPSGYVTVYSHLDRFRGGIAAYAREQQYEKESFGIDVTVPAGRLPVREGDVIGYSGNSGSSGGPHLHFEIRDGRTQEPLDPLSFGIPIRDNLPPQILWVRIYPFGTSGMVDHATMPATLQATGGSGIYGVVAADTVMVSGDVYFGIEAYDYHNASTIRCGIKSIELTVDGKKIFGQSVERFAFADTRYVNAILDYSQNQRNRQRFLRSYIAPGNRMHIFDGVVNRGITSFTDRNPHKIQYVVKDVSGNTSRITFWVVSHPPVPDGARPQEEHPPVNPFTLNRENSFRNELIVFTIPANALYEDIDFSYCSAPPVNGSYARIHQLHDEETPLHLACDLSVRAETLPQRLESKALLVKVEKEGKLVSQGGTFRDGYVSGRIREFGAYTIGIDTIPPKIKPLNIYSGKNISKQGSIALAISDDVAGISTYRGTLNGRWILMDYDPKTNRLVYTYDDRIKPGKNLFQLVVIDGVGNRTDYKATLIR